MINVNKVSLRNGFSDRNNLKSENKELQLLEFNTRTKVRLLNLLKLFYGNMFKGKSREKQFFIKKALTDIYIENIQLNKIYTDRSLFYYFDKTFEQGTYDEVLTIIEYFYSNLFRNSFDKIEFSKCINNIFKEEFVGYQLIDGFIVPITNQIEIDSIKNSLVSNDSETSTHLKKALKLLSDRSKPDYENSIKESITAVETKCTILNNNNTSSGLGGALDNIEKQGYKIHGALKEGFKKLYGYTSNAKGVRHAGNLQSPNSTREEAIFMLVACSAFINYLNSIESNIKTVV